MPVIGVNPEEAAQGANAVVHAATQLDGVLRDYQNAVQQAWLAAGEPPVMQGYDDWGPHQIDSIVAVEHHAGLVAASIHQAATTAVRTDYSVAGTFPAG
jgi:hypothetical protein